MLYPFAGEEPKIAEDVFLAPGCKIIGEVKIKEGASVWYNAVIRGDLAKIEIGQQSNIQENSSLHVDHDQELIIGDKVTIGHGAVIHSCAIKDNCLIGMGATILNGAVIGENSIIGANALITEGKKIPPGSLVIGVPGKVIKQLNNKQIKQLSQHAEDYAKLASKYKNP